MPMHDWTKVAPGTYHAFHYQWIASLVNTLNAGRLPPGYFAMPEQRIPSSEPDVIALELGGRFKPKEGDGGLALQTVAPRTRFVMESDSQNYARRANRLTVRHPDGEVVAVIELISPGNKASDRAFKAFVQKAIDFLEEGIHLLIVDPFPPTPRDPEGIHGAIWRECCNEGFELPLDKPLTCVSYQSDEHRIAYVEPIAVGDPLPEMPLYLATGQYVWCPLESTYQTTWSVFPAPLQGKLVSSN